MYQDGIYQKYSMVIIVFRQFYHSKSETLEIAYNMKYILLVMYSLVYPQTIECKNNFYVHSNIILSNPK